ncbi:MAG: zf-HC2 domain-containing protein [Actinobacteria bacterium]|nr:zf-HC2 domain-containing protein [Actinomycetota bacterium]
MDIDFVNRVRDRIECMRVRPLLQSFLDGELDKPQRQRVAAHLEACRRCGLAASTYESLKRRLGRFGQPADPDAVARLTDFVDRLADAPDGDGRDGTG